MVGAILEKWDPRELRELIDCHLSRDQQRPIIAADDRGFRRTFLGAELADDRFQNVSRRHDAFKVAVFVNDETDMDRRRLKN